MIMTLEQILSATALVLLTSAALILPGRDRNAAARGLAVALLALAALEMVDLFSLLRPPSSMPWHRWALAVGSLQAGAWLYYAWARTSGTDRQHPAVALAACCVGGTLTAFVLLSGGEAFFRDPGVARDSLLLTERGYFFYLALSVCLLGALVQVVSPLATLSGTERWKIKFELLGVATLLAVQLGHYAHVLLDRAVAPDSLPLRSAAVVIAIPLLFYSRRRQGGGLALQFSRKVAYRSISLLIVALYLVLLALLDEGTRDFGESFPRDLLVLIGLAGALLLASCLLSEKFKRGILVLLHKNFYRTKYDYRQEWAACTERLSAASDEKSLYQAVLNLFCTTFGVQGAVLFQRDGTDGVLRPVQALELDMEPMDMSLPGELVRSFGDGSWIVSALDLPPEVRKNEGEWLSRHRISLLVPLVFDSRLEGVVALGERIADFEALSYEDFDLMRMLARQATSTLMCLRFAEQLCITREMAHLGRISTFLLHDMKTLVSSLALVTDNAEEHLENPAFRHDMVLTLKHTVGTMNALVNRLKNLKEQTEWDMRECDLLEIASRATELAGNPAIDLEGAPVTIRADREALVKVVLNLVVNALEAGGEGGTVRVETGKRREAFLRVSDQGCGMSPEFIEEQLFRPFRTSKPRGFGIGLYQCRHIVQVHGGRIEVESAPGRGSRFTVYLPLTGNAAEMDRSEVSPSDSRGLHLKEVRIG